MELRSCIHWHFIQALKDGLVVKSLNVNRGRPVLKFKELKEVYEADDENYQKPNDEFEGFLSDSNRIKFERPTVSDSDVPESSCCEDDTGRNNDSDGERYSDSDDLGIGKITLKQIKEKCKVKKRKRSKFVDSRTDELCISVKEETDEDDCDLMEPLVSWKTKISKKVKVKTRCLRNHVSTTPRSALSMVKVEQIATDQDFVVSTESLLAVVQVKVEAPEPYSSANQNTMCDSSLLCDDRVDSCRDIQKSGEVAKIGTEGDLETKASVSDDVKVSVCDNDWVNSCGEVSTEATSIASECESVLATEFSLIYDDRVDSCGEVPSELHVIDSGRESSLAYDDRADSYGVLPSDATAITTECNPHAEASVALTRDPQHFVISEMLLRSGANSEHDKAVNGSMDSCGTVHREVNELTTESFLGTETLTSGIEKLQHCVLNEVSHDYVEHAYSEPEQSINTSCVDGKQVDIAERKDDQDSDSTIPESEGVIYVDQTPCASISQEPMLPGSDCSTDVPDVYPCLSINNVIPHKIDSNLKVKSINVSAHGCHHQIESDLRSDSCALDGSAMDDLLSIQESSATYSSDAQCSLALSNCFIPSREDSPTTETKQSQSSSVVAENCLPQMLDCDACEQLTGSSGDVDHYSKLDPPPQRLLSTRKAISPASQEKLCKAMESIEIREEDHYRPHKKLCFGQQDGNETKVGKVERTGGITKIRFSVNQKQNIVKPKHEKRNTQTNAVSYGPHPSHGAPRFTTGCNSIESCSKSAIAFSQRQMQDIECLASKLANELKTMKEIAEDRLYSDASLSTPTKYKPNEVRMAIKSATKVEQLANKWLSMMARDCNRFCKIMALAEKDSDAPPPESVANKERKKITFADEAGEELCHVKFFEKNLTGSFEPDAEKPNQVLT